MCGARVRLSGAQAMTQPSAEAVAKATLLLMQPALQVTELALALDAFAKGRERAVWEEVIKVAEETAETLAAEYAPDDDSRNLGGLVQQDFRKIVDALRARLLDAGVKGDEGISTDE